MQKNLLVNPFNLLTKKAGRLPLTLKISFFILISCTVYSQKKSVRKITPIDSSTLKIEIDRALSKYGLKSKGFSINVISINQKGGQTAYTINNNYYHDTAYVADSVNFQYALKKIDNSTLLYVYPKYGVWYEPFVYYDTSIHEDIILTNGMTNILSGLTLNYKNETEHIMVGYKLGSTISKNSPFVLKLLPDYLNATYVFGDYSNEKKSYALIKGKIVWKPLPPESN